MLHDSTFASLLGYRKYGIKVSTDENIRDPVEKKRTFLILLTFCQYFLASLLVIQLHHDEARCIFLAVLIAMEVKAKKDSFTYPLLAYFCFALKLIKIDKIKSK